MPQFVRMYIRNVAIGFLLAVVVPYMPLIYFFLAALSWLILAVQTIITAPFWLMQMFYPNRQGGLQGTSIARALMVLLALLVRPALIIIGLIFCMMLMRENRSRPSGTMMMPALTISWAARPVRS